MSEPIPPDRRNPRRAYDRDGRELPVATIGGDRAQGSRSLEVWCNPCNRSVVIGTDGLPDPLPLPDVPIVLGLVCSRCRKPASSVQMDVHAHYARCRTPTGQPFSTLPAHYRVIPWQAIVGAERGARLIAAWAARRSDQAFDATTGIALAS